MPPKRSNYNRSMVPSGSGFSDSSIQHYAANFGGQKFQVQEAVSKRCERSVSATQNKVTFKETTTTTKTLTFQNQNPSKSFSGRSQRSIEYHDSGAYGSKSRNPRGDMYYD